MAKQAAKHQDAAHTVALSSNKYSERLRRLSKKYTEVNGVLLNFKVYISDNMNAFVVPDGSVRVFSGLMDLMDDAELMFVVGHEIGHVALGHSKKQTQSAYAARGAGKTTDSQSNTTGNTLAASELGGFAEALINARFSPSEERSSDDYGLKLMKEKGFDTRKAVSALKKLADLEGSHNILSCHPSPGQRATRIRNQL
ncbi:MAG: M48 family metalloprotease [Gammaproteobacteria bacterium]|nr:M48 family metalloprotease [Gammaproteobacteria bacterium]